MTLPTAHLVAGLAYGDEGKGSIVDALVHKYNADLVIRYNGGSQCGHNVITPDGRHHTFSQFGSGSFVSNVHTHLSRFMLVNPINMMCEEEHLRQVGVSDIWKRTTVHAKAVIITPYQKALNRILEIHRGKSKHGSCGQGIGVARDHHLTHKEKVLFAGDLKNSILAKDKLEFIRKLCLEQVSEVGYKADFEEAKIIYDSCSVDWVYQHYRHWPVQVVDCFSSVLEDHAHVVFEGAQGVLLDEVYGTSPYNTWTDTTFNNAIILLKDCGFNGKQNRVGVLRTYFTRHGAGPFPTEDNTLNYPEPHNTTNRYQDNFRLGHIDFKSVDYALKVVGGVDYLALNHMDVVPESIRWKVHELLSEKASIAIDGAGPLWTDKYFTM